MITFDSVPRLWTLVTSRHAHKLKTVQQPPLIHDLNVLNKGDARRLFCYWAFKTDDVPRWVNRELVEEEISKCKGLPFALKLIGESLTRTGVDVLQLESQVNVLQLESQLNVLQLESQLFRDCFMDLGAFPKDTWNPIDNLLDIWVYVRGMTWGEAYCTLLEFQSRCLLNVKYEMANTTHERRNHYQQRRSFFPENMTEYGCGGLLQFSQHDVLRDLAIHLARNDSDRRWLLMPQPQPNVPQEWQCEGGSLVGAAGVADVAHAQVISIHISVNSMSADDWPSLHFPHTKALLLHMSSKNEDRKYTLPSFIRNMSKLQVLVIKSNNTSESLIVHLHGLHCLQSLYIDAQDLTIKDLDLPKLKKLSLVRHSLEGMLTLSDHTLAKLSSFLEILIIWNYHSKIPKMHCKNLKALQIKCHLHHIISNKELPNEIGELERLKRLVLMDFHELECLPLSIGKLSCLKELVLYNAMSLRALPEDIIEGLQHQLETLDLMFCRFPLSPNIGRLQCLKKLRLAFFHIVYVLPESLVELQHLEVLELRYFYSLKELPDNIGQLTCLRELILEATDNLYGLPESLVELTSLEALILINCKSLQ